MNLLRAFASGGYANLEHVHQWMLGFVADSPQRERYETLADQIGQTMNFMRAIGIDPESHPELRQTDFFTSHEALLLGYEQAMTRVDSTTGDWYATSGHMIWIGDRTRQPDHAHVEFCRGVKNPIGLKCGPSLDTDGLIRADRHPEPGERAGPAHPHLPHGRRQGGGKAAAAHPRDRARGTHGRLVMRSDARQHDHPEPLQDAAVRPDPSARCEDFFAVHHAEGTHAGGIHVEMTGQNVTECTGGARAISAEDLSDRYHTHCDPRLNAEQSLELAFLVAELLKRERVEREVKVAAQA